MSDHRTVVLMNTETLVEVTLRVPILEIKAEHLTNTEPKFIDAAHVEAAADKAREDYENVYGGHYLVTNILRGDDE